MCGIVGFVGENEAAPILMEGLRRLEYRGYDSAGIAVKGDNVTVVKGKGRIDNLAISVNEVKPLGTIGIGHTRWATHGAPDRLNAHPHTSKNNIATLVHNGIIENYIELKNMDICIISGKVEKRYDKYQVIVNKIKRVDYE